MIALIIAAILIYNRRRWVSGSWQRNTGYALAAFFAVVAVVTYTT